MKAPSPLLIGFYSNAKEHLSDVAISYQSRKVTYDQLLTRVEFYAKYIAMVLNGDNTKPICLLGDDKLDLITWQLAVLRAGCFFAVLDHNAPESVVKESIEKLGAKLTVIINKTESNKLDEKWEKAQLPHQVYCARKLLVEKKLPVGEESSTLLPKIGDIPADSTAYILLTSGSTGTPKAVMQTHQGLYQQMKRYYRIINIENNAEERFSNFAPLCHDQGIVDVYAALLSPGGKLGLFDVEKLINSENGIEQAREFLRKNAISVFSGIPDVFKMIFTNLPKEQLPDLRVIAIGADEVKKEHLKVFSDFCPKESALYNSYGASECSWICGHKITIKEAEKLLLDEEAKSIPIGYPEASLTVFIRPIEDNDNSEAQINKRGELCIAGESVSPGYFNNLEATEKAFFQHEKKYFYATGDIVERQGETLLHKGRLARLEKIMGKRVDINELEKSLCQLLKVEECIVVTVAFGEQKILCAFTASPQTHEEKPTWRLSAADSIIQMNLSPHLRPTYLFELKEFPTLTSLKVDRKKLAEIAKENLSLAEEYEGSSIEKLVLSKAKKISGMPCDLDNKLSDKMSSMALAAFREAINQGLGKTLVNFSDLGESTTFRKLAEVLQKRVDNLAAPNMVIEYYKYSEVAIFKHEMIKRMMRYFEERSPQLKLIACISIPDFIKKLHEQAKSGALRVGYTVPVPLYAQIAEDNREEHPIACMVDFNKKNGQLIVWISDSVGGINRYSSALISKLKEAPDLQIKIYIDYSKRQEKRDYYNCVFDAFSFLTNGFAEDLPTLIIPSLEKTPEKHYFQIPVKRIHRIPQFLLDEPPNDRAVIDVYALNYLGMFYSRLVEAVYKQDGNEKQIPSLKSLIPKEISYSTSDYRCFSDQFNRKLIEADEDKHGNVYAQLVNSVVMHDCVDLGRVVSSLDNDQLTDVFTILTTEDERKTYIKGIDDLEIILSYLTENQRSIVWEKLGPQLLKIDMDDQKLVCLLAKLSEEECHMAFDIYMELTQRNKHCLDALFVLSICKYFNESSIGTILNKYNFLLDAIRNPSHFDIFKNVSAQKKLLVYKLVKEKLVNSVKTGNYFYLLVETLDMPQRLELIESFKGKFSNFTKNDYDLEFVFRAEDILNVRIEELKSIIQTMIKNEGNLIEMISSMTKDNVKSTKLIIIDKIRSEVLPILEWLNTVDTSRILDRFTYCSDESNDVRKIIISNICERQAINAFFEYYPKWNGKTAPEIDEMKKIIQFAFSKNQKTPGLFSNNALNPAQTRQALVKAGVSDSIFEEDSDVEAKTKLAIEQIVQKIQSTLAKNSMSSS